jgi:ketol-acid reductoisomerase
VRGRYCEECAAWLFGERAAIAGGLGAGIKAAAEVATKMLGGG